MRFRQLAQHVFDTRPFAEQSAEGVGVMLRRVRVLQTDHLVADGGGGGEEAQQRGCRRAA